MINKRNLSILLFLIILFGTISIVSANDLDGADVQTGIDDNVPVQPDSHGDIIEGDSAGHDDVLKQSDSNQDVLGDGPESFSKLYDKINNNTDSEIVLDCNYTYDSATDSAYVLGVPINHNVTIDGRGHTIDGLSIAKGFKIDNCNVLIKNVTFVHLGQFSNSNSNYNGGAIFSKYYATPTTKVKVVDSTFTSCKGYWGGALYNVEAENCVFTQNSACYAGAMYMTSAKGCTFKQNSAVANGGACYNVASDHCTFTGNAAASYNNGNGGGQYGGTATNCEFRSNSAKYGGGFYGSSSSSYALNCNFISNTATNGAGAYSGSTSSRVQLVNCEFRSNEASNNYGGSYACKRVLCTYLSNKAKNYPNYDSSSPTGYATLRVPSSYEAEYPSPVEIPVNLTYTTDGGKLLQIVKSVSISLYKDGSFVSSYSCMSGSKWTVNLERGSYRATFSGGSSSASCNILVCVNKTKISSNGPHEMMQFDDEFITATLTNWTGGPLSGFNVTVTNGQGLSEILTTDGNGQIRISLDNVSYGYYQYTFKFEGNEFYEPSTVYHTLNIKRINVNINSLDEITTYFNKSAVLIGNLTDDDGNLLNNYNLTVSINNNNSLLYVEDGEFKIELPFLEPGKYQMYVGYDGNKTHTNTYKIVNVIINRVPTEVLSGNVYAFYKEGKVYAMLKDKFGDVLSDQYLNLFIGTTLIKSLKTNETGEVEFDLGDVGNGTYDASVSFNGTSRYLFSLKEIKLKIGKLDTKIATDGITAIYGENGTLIAYLTDINGNIVQNADMRFVIGSLTKPLKTDSNGKAELNLTEEIPIGKYTGRVYFDGNERYASSNKPVVVTIGTIPTQITATDLTCFYNETAYVNVTLKDKYGNPIRNATVTLSTSGITFTAITNETGEAEILIKLPAKSYDATVAYGGNESYSASSTTSTIVIKKIDKVNTVLTAKSLTAVYNDIKYLVATLSDINGTAVGNAQIKVKIGDKTQVLTTDDQGQIKISTAGLTPKTYPVSIVFSGDDKYIGYSSNVKILVKKATPKLIGYSKVNYKLKAVKKYTVILKSNKNQVLKNVRVTIKFKTKTYAVKTNAKGQAIFKFTHLNKRGTYKAVVTFANSYYNRVNKVVNIYVK